MEDELLLKYRALLESSDQELLLYRAALVRIRNIVSGTDPDLDRGDIVGLCDTLLARPGRVLGRSIE